MSDHHEPEATGSIPSPSSANVPRLQSVQAKESFDKENLLLPDKVVSSRSAITESSKEDVSVQPPLQGKKVKISPKQPANIICHGLTSVVPILSQAPCKTPPLVIPSTGTLAHSVVSLLPKVISPPSPAPSTMPLNAAMLPIPAVRGQENACINETTNANILKPNTVTNLAARGTTSRPKIPVNETIPDVIPDFFPGKVDAKRFPARHFELSSLEIGSWKYEANSNGSFSTTTSRLKVIFSQMKFVYEFELRTSSFSGNIPFFQREKVMACIEVPFSSVTGLNISKNGEVVIEVDSQPSMYLGKQVLFSSATGCARPAKYDTSRSVDLTGGQLQAYPYHKIKLSSNNLRYRLESFDPRFDALLRTPISVDVSKRLAVKENPSVKQKKTSEPKGQPGTKRPRRSSSSSITGEMGCMCAAGCNTLRCSCFKTNGMCSYACKCFSCKNPLNILADNGVNIEQAKEDPCLMQNIRKMTNLDKFMKEHLARTSCCNTEFSMKDACVGVVECPKCDQDRVYRFSWCSLSFCDEENRPRNHCVICNRCGDYRDSHCYRCNKCYFAGTGGLFECPCFGRPSFVDRLASFINNLDSSESNSDDDCY